MHRKFSPGVRDAHSHFKRFWHSDFETWHVEDEMPRMRAISMSVFLTESHEFNGPLMLVPGSHRTYVRCAGETPENHYEQSLRRQEFGVPNRNALETLVQQGGIVAPTGPAGSVVFFECNTMHGSAGNLSPTPRINLFAVYNSMHNLLVVAAGTGVALEFKTLHPPFVSQTSAELLYAREGSQSRYH